MQQRTTSFLFATLMVGGMVTSGFGQTPLRFAVNDAASSGTLAKPYQDGVAAANDKAEFALAEIGPVVYHAHTAYDFGSDASGDGDGRPESGERIELAVTVINQGDETAEGVVGILSTSDPVVTISDNFNTWNDISGGAAQDNLGNFVFDINSNLAQDKTVAFTLTVSANGVDDMISTFQVAVYAQDQIRINAPTDLTPFGPTATTLPMVWTDNSDNEDGFAIERMIGETGNWVELARVEANVIFYHDVGLSGGQTYSYRVRAFRGAIFSDYSNIITFTPPVQPFTNINVSLPAVDFGSVAWGDYDADGDLDILMVGPSTRDTVATVFRNDGGNFTDIHAGLIKLGAAATAWGDYDNDGDLDILLAGAADYLSNRVTKIYRNDSGTFVDIAAALTGVSFPAVAWGDYDNDGDLDVLIAGYGSFSGSPLTKIYRNDDGNFVDAAAALPNLYGGIAVWGDYDNDGDLDILLAGESSLNNFQTKIFRNDSGHFTDIGAAITAVGRGAGAWGDYDNDGDLDILLTGYTGAITLLSAIYRNDGGIFLNINAGLVDVDGRTAAWGDYDNDGDLDVLLNGDRFSGGPVFKIYRNDDGSFADLSALLTSGITDEAQWGDYDNDGDLDILAGPYLYRNEVNAPNTVPTAPANLTAAVNGNSATLSWNRGGDNETAPSSLTHNLRVGTTPGGNEIISAMAEANTGFRRIPQAGNAGHNTSWTINNLPAGEIYWSVQALDHAFAGSAFAPENSFVVAGMAAPRDLQAQARFQAVLLTWVPNQDPSVVRYYIYGGTTPQPTTRIDSIDGAASGTKMLAGLSNGTTYYFRLTAVNNAGSESAFSNEASATPFFETFTAITVIEQTTAPTYFAAWGDYDNDGDFDILVRTQIYRNDNGTFGNTVIELSRYGGNIAWGDYDNDGDLDILSGVFIYRNDHNNFVDLGIQLAGGNGFVAWGDYDNDGDLDILLSSRVYRNDRGIFNDTGVRLSFASAWGDYDNDGDLDILDSEKIYRHDNGSFVDIGATLSSARAWGDYDSDGDLDILAASKVYRNNNGNFVDINAALPAGIGFNVAWGDYDHDGDLDILLSGSSTGESGLSAVYRNDGGNFVDSGIPLAGLRTAVAAWGDYDHDGDLDILLSGSPEFGNLTKVYRNNAISPNPTPTAPTNLAALITGNAVKFGWNKATDNETAQNALTYNLRVGKTPGGSEVISAMSAASSGLRRVAQLGNVNQNASWTLKNLPPGTYYWSVQALDNNFAGSAFAPERSFMIGLAVWPGDANNDKLVNQADVLPIGLHWNKTGPPRQNASITWTEQLATPWTPEAATYVDANGDGTVNQADVLPIGLNWNKTHSASPLVAGNADGAIGRNKVNAATLSMTIIGDTSPGQEFWIEVRVAEVADLFGISFELLYSPTTFVEAQIAEAGSMLGNEVIFLPNLDNALGKVSIGLTRKSGQSGVDGSGMMARIKMKMTSSAAVGAMTNLMLQNVMANDSLGQPIQLTVAGQALVTEVTAASEAGLPTAFALHPNIPNPFNPSTTIKYDLAAPSEVMVMIFDMLGKPVRTLVSERQPAGRYAIKWDGRDSHGQQVASGVFICQLRVADSDQGGAGTFVQNRKMLLLQ